MVNQFDIMKSPLGRKMAEHFRVPYRNLSRLVVTAPLRYKIYNIPKKKGGSRKIAHPARELKSLQRWLLNEILADKKIHPSAFAYRKGLSIKDNAILHAKSNYLLKMDFENFFPSITPDDLLQKLSANELNSHDEHLLSQIFFFKETREDPLVLSIGAPSSPLISNLVMTEFDKVITDFCSENGICYSRYADDLTFSTDQRNTLGECEAFILDLCNKIKSPHLSINANKTVHTSRKHHRRVTGLVLTNDGRVSLGRDRKRKIRAALHNFHVGRLGSENIPEIKGWLAYANAIEPNFLESLRKKYGDEVEELLN